LLFKVFKDSYNFFDRHWHTTMAAAILSVGLAVVVSLIIRKILPLPATDIITSAESTFKLGYNDLIEVALIFLASIWFRGFIAAHANAQLQPSQYKTGDVLRQSAAVYPRVLMVNIVVLVVIYTGLLIALPALSLGYIGVLFAIPALVFYIWFSMVTPSVVMEDIRGPLKVLIRSRMLVLGYFWHVLFIHMVTAVPALAINGIPDDTVYFWPIMVFINVTTAILYSLLITFTYVNLRLVKGETIVDSPATSHNTV